MCISNSIIKKIPEVVFYAPKQGDSYRIIKFGAKDYIGEISFSKRNELFIEHLYINKEYRGNGFGKLALNFAENLSKKIGLKGNLRVLAAKLDDKDLAPHIFYRKYGFKAFHKELTKVIDKCIKQNLPLDEIHSMPAFMYYINNWKNKK